MVAGCLSPPHRVSVFLSVAGLLLLLLASSSPGLCFSFYPLTYLLPSHSFPRLSPENRQTYLSILLPSLAFLSSLPLQAAAALLTAGVPPGTGSCLFLLSLCIPTAATGHAGLRATLALFSLGCHFVGAIFLPVTSHSQPASHRL